MYHPPTLIGTCRPDVRIWADDMDVCDLELEMQIDVLKVCPWALYITPWPLLCIEHIVTTIKMGRPTICSS